MSPAFLITIYCVVVVAASLAGGALPSRISFTHTRIQLMVSFVAGLMLGVALLHMLPHAAHYTRTLDHAVLWMTGGLLLMFFLIRAFHFHSHEVGTEEEHEHAHAHPFQGARSLGWVGVAIGLSLHSAVDGVALASSTLAEAHVEPRPLLPGMGAFLAVFLHKPLDALAVTALMMAGGYRARTQLLVNIAFALMCPLGAAVFHAGAAMGSHAFLGSALALAAGGFLCISLADLLPEVQFHRHDRLKLSAALLLGVGLAYAVTFMESGFHDH